MIQAIVYDAVGTLIHVQPSVAILYADCGRRFGSRLDAAELRRRFACAFAAQDHLDAQAGWRTSEARERQRWQAIVAQVLDDVSDGSGCFESLFAEFARPEAWSCDPAALEVLAAARRRGYRQVMASNFDQRLHGVMAGLAARRYLERVIISSEIGWRKPAAEFFTAVAERLRLPPEAILFVGDDRTNDYEPARRAGMRSLLFDPHQRHLDIETDRVQRIEDVLEKLGEACVP